MSNMFVELSSSPNWNVSLSEGPTSKLVKVPVAVLGEWKHPEYGDLKFDQNDFDQIKFNWQNNVLGYEPPLFLGHDANPNVFGGQPSVAFQTDLVQEGNVLFGLYDPVDKNVLKQVEEGVWRYSSSETVRNAASKTTGQPIGTVLTAMALTNQPFLTGLPKVQVVEQKLSDVSDSNTLKFIFPTMTQSTSEQETLNTGAPPSPTPPPAPMPTPVTANTISLNLSAQELADKFSKIESDNQALADLQAQNAQLKADNEALKLSEATLRSQYDQLNSTVQAIVERTKKIDLSEKITRLNQLNLPKEVKTDFSTKLSEGFFTPEQEEFQFQQFQQLSDVNAKLYTQYQGIQESEASAENSLELNPYKDIIQRNLKLAEEKRQKQQLA